MTDHSWRLGHSNRRAAPAASAFRSSHLSQRRVDANLALGSGRWLTAPPTRLGGMAFGPGHPPPPATPRRCDGTRPPARSPRRRAPRAAVPTA